MFCIGLIQRIRYLGGCSPGLGEPHKSCVPCVLDVHVLLLLLIKLLAPRICFVIILNLNKWYQSVLGFKLEWEFDLSKSYDKRKEFQSAKIQWTKLSTVEDAYERLFASERSLYTFGR